MEHTLYVCPGDHDRSCMFCDGGLSACSVCGAFEGMWPDECPGSQMTGAVGDAVYNGQMNFREGEWRFECCKAMRHIHDTENYMAEAGYKPDGLNAAGNTKWVKVEDNNV